MGFNSGFKGLRILKIVHIYFRIYSINYKSIKLYRYAHHACKKLDTELELQTHIQQNSTNPDAGYPDRLGPLGKSVDNSTKLTCLEITGYRIKYSTVLWLTELQIRRGRKV